jgi:hypothetical protein
MPGFLLLPLAYLILYTINTHNLQLSSFTYSCYQYCTTDSYKPPELPRHKGLETNKRLAAYQTSRRTPRLHRRPATSSRSQPITEATDLLL